MNPEGQLAFLLTGHIGRDTKNPHSSAIVFSPRNNFPKKNNKICQYYHYRLASTTELHSTVRDLLPELLSLPKHTRNTILATEHNLFLESCIDGGGGGTGE